MVRTEVSFLIVDPEDTARFIQIRGEVEVTTDGEVEELDQLTQRYTRHPITMDTSIQRRK